MRLQDMKKFMILFVFVCGAGLKPACRHYIGCTPDVPEKKAETRLVRTNPERLPGKGGWL